ncbi:MAG: hypothetical protein KKD94_05085 [Nanoarchaeota archaeon]|nr:hypothetical protein [Nanoarchaeota archaeon]MBU1988824.1 hypothetical protein [Nanoarchaeota archaeon]
MIRMKGCVQIREEIEEAEQLTDDGRYQEARDAIRTAELMLSGYASWRYGKGVSALQEEISQVNQQIDEGEKK